MDLTLQGNIAYVADDFGGLQLVDISKPTELKLLDEYETSWGARDVNVIGDVAYVAEMYNGLQNFKVPLPTVGSISIGGTAIQNQTLSIIHKDNNLPSTSLSYQWMSNGLPVDGAVQNSYTLKQSDVGKTISVNATYNNPFGNLEKISSDAAAIRNANDEPTGSVIISGKAQKGETLTVSNTLADADGLGVISYQWRTDDEILPNATQTTYNLTQADVGKKFSVSASYTDGFGQFETVTSESVEIANINDAPTGKVNIEGTAKVGQKLSASNTLNDADGLGDLHYQWLSDGKAIKTATQATYTIDKTDVGKTISVAVSYTDGANTLESVTSDGVVVAKATVNGLTKTGDAKNNKLEGAAKNDDLSGLSGNDTLVGKAGNDTLNGGDGKDSLTGGVGFDELTGGSGADKFIFTDIRDAMISRASIDVIADFNHKEGDKIDLSAIDANTAVKKDQAFSKPVSGEEFSGKFAKAGQLFFETSTSILYGNVNKDGAADFAIQLNGVSALAASDLVL